MNVRYSAIVLLLIGYNSLYSNTTPVKGDHFQYQIDGQKETWKELYSDLSKTKNLFENGIPTAAFTTLKDAITAVLDDVVSAQRGQTNISQSNKDLLTSSWATLQHASNYFIEAIQANLHLPTMPAAQIPTPARIKTISNQVEQLIPRLQKISKMSWSYTDVIDVRKFKELLALMAKDLISLLEKLSPQLQQLSNKIIVSNKLREQKEREEKTGVKPR